MCNPADACGYMYSCSDAQSSVDRSFRSPVDLVANISHYKIFHDFMHMRAKTICAVNSDVNSAVNSYIMFARICMK